ncbi:unnamed protein product [Cyprideis torosa]|uniref:Syndecan/Neurexin domain-containing protein n=1 Tax=Cyprideis torosa TaxID=163714 RepID=A0A7R8WAB4_9CRUS|nr:unnamed protein product [Cyprideis torosa]CAG0890785.1 unnamed protein product [Cyprideis torosa]
MGPLQYVEGGKHCVSKLYCVSKLFCVSLGRNHEPGYGNSYWDAQEGSGDSYNDVERGGGAADKKQTAGTRTEVEETKGKGLGRARVPFARLVVIDDVRTAGSGDWSPKSTAVDGRTDDEDFARVYTRTNTDEVEGSGEGLDEVKGSGEGLDEVEGSGEGLDEVEGSGEGLDEVKGSGDGGYDDKDDSWGRPGGADVWGKPKKEDSGSYGTVVYGKDDTSDGFDVGGPIDTGAANIPDLYSPMETPETKQENSGIEPPSHTPPSSGDGSRDGLAEEAPAERPASFFAQPGILAAVIGGAVVGLLCTTLLVMYIVYRMRKMDEGSYPLDNSHKAMAYKSSNEFYA